MLARRSRLPTFTDRLRLGAAGIPVSPFCVGMVSDPKTIPHAFDAGVNAFFVTTDMHWPLYEPTRRGLAQLFARPGTRDQVVVFGCNYTAQAEFSYGPFGELIDAVPGMGRVDVLVAGGAYAADARVRAERFRGHIERGLFGARAVGVTFHDRVAAAQLAYEDCLDIGFVRYNAHHRGAATDIFPHVRRPRTQLLYNFKSTQGFVSPELAKRAALDPELWYPSVADQYRFVLTRPELDGILCSPRNPAEIDALAAAMAEGPFDADDEAHFGALYDSAHLLDVH